MSSECFWELFAETGDIEYYLLYHDLSKNEVSTQQEVMKKERAS